MAKKSASAKAKAAKQTNSPSASRRKFIMLPAAALAIGGTAFGLNAFEMNKRELHDLSVVGEGQPVIVQIHDPGCPTCRRLKSVVQNSLKSDDGVHFRLADITSSEGRALQEKYNVPHVTLLFFDEKGKHVHTTQGMQTKQSIRSALGTAFGAHS